MEYSTHLDIYNLKEDDFKDDMMLSLTTLVYFLNKPLAQLEELAKHPNFNKKKNILFVGPSTFDVVRPQITKLVAQIKDSEYSHVYQASVNAMNTLYRDEIFRDIKDFIPKKPKSTKTL